MPAGVGPTGPVPDGDAGGPQPQVGGVDVGRLQQLLAGSRHRLQARQASEVRQGGHWPHLVLSLDLTGRDYRHDQPSNASRSSTYEVARSPYVQAATSTPERASS